MSEPIEDLRQRLADRSPEVRRRAVAGIEGDEGPEAADIVMRALADEDWRVRKEASRAAGRLAHAPAMIERLIDAMTQPDDISLRNAAAEALCGIGSPAVTAILARLDGMAPGGRKISLEVIGSSHDPRASSVLVDALGDTDPNVRACAAEWLGEAGGEEAEHALLQALASSDTFLAMAALQSLNRLGTRVPVDLLHRLGRRRIFGPDLLLAMGRSGSEEFVPYLEAWLPDDPVAAMALETLHACSPAAARAVEDMLARASEPVLGSLARWVHDGGPSEQRAAVACLLWSRRREVVPVLAEAAQSEALHQQILEGLASWGRVAMDALDDLLSVKTGRDLASVIGLLSRLLDERAGSERMALFAAYLGSADLQVATAAAGAVARFGDARVAPRLLELTASSDERARRAAGHALVEVGRRHPEAVREIVRRVEIEGERGIQICRVLEVVGIPEDAALLSSALGSPRADLRRTALGALAAVAGAGAVDTLSLAMTDEDVGVRMAAAAALARVGPAAAETIVSALRTAEGPLKAALVRALGHVGHPEAPSILRHLCLGPADEALAALEAMRQLGLPPDETGDEILGNPEPEVVKQAMIALGDTASTGRLLDLVHHDAWDVRLAAVERLAARVAEPTVAETLSGRLPIEEDDLVREAIHRALRARGRER